MFDAALKRLQADSKPKDSHEEKIVHRLRELAGDASLPRLLTLWAGIVVEKLPSLQGMDAANYVRYKAIAHALHATARFVDDL